MRNTLAALAAALSLHGGVGIAAAEPTLTAQTVTGREVTLIAVGRWGEKPTIKYLQSKSGDAAEMEWWSPDGTAMATPPPAAARVRPIRTSGLGGKDWREFVLLTRSSKAGESAKRERTMPRWNLASNDRLVSGFGHSESVDRDGIRLSTSLVLIPGGEDSATLDYGYSSGVYDKVATVSPLQRIERVGNVEKSTYTSGDGATSAEYLVTQPILVGDVSVVAITGPSVQRLVANRTSGEPLIGESLDMQHAGKRYIQTWKFPALETQDLRGFEIQSEKIARLRFADVSLEPGKKTTPTVEKMEAQ